VNKVCICITLDTYVPSPFLMSFIGMQRVGPDYDASSVIVTYGALTYDAMNQATEGFLRTDCTHLLFLESDMNHPNDTIPRLLKHDLPVVGGIQTFKVPPFVPMIYRYRREDEPASGTRDDNGPYVPIGKWDRGKLIEVDGIATGCLLVRRDVFEKVKRPWFTFAEGTQDLYFCRGIHDAGFKIYCDTSIECGHIGSVTVGVSDYLRYGAVR